MNKLVTAVGLSFAMLVLPGIAGAQSPANTQNSKMTQCNADAKAKNLAGPARKAFMKECLGARQGAAPQGRHLNAQQEKMVKCNAEAKTKTLRGDARKSFMRECLRGKK